MFLDNDDWKPGDGLCAPMSTSKLERPYDKEEGLFADTIDITKKFNKQEKPKILVCDHQKIYAPYQLQAFPPQKPWICSLCGTEGIEGIDVIGFIETEDYYDLKKKFSK